MPHDELAKYVGNHGGAYTDIDGMSKQFTYVDHDKKTTISTHNEDTKEVKEALKSHTDQVIEAILSLPAVNAVRNPDGLYEEFIIRDKELGISWNEHVVRDALPLNSTLRYNLFNQVWKASVKMQYWNEDMSYEDIIKGEWMKWR